MLLHSGIIRFHVWLENKIKIIRNLYFKRFIYISHWSIRKNNLQVLFFLLKIKRMNTPFKYFGTLSCISNPWNNNNNVNFINRICIFFLLKLSIYSGPLFFWNQLWIKEIEESRVMRKKITKYLIEGI